MRLFLGASIVTALFLTDAGLYAKSAEAVILENRVANETIIIGDSIFALNGVIDKELEVLSSKSIDSYARNGALMNGIVRQYQQARENGTARIVIMNGGGNDVLARMRDCRAFNQTCINAIENAVSQGVDLVNQMEEDGVERIYYLGYYYTTSFASGLGEAVDYAMSRVPAICESTTIPCEVIDTREAMQGPGNLIWDGIHPSRSGSIKMARLLWESMQDNVD